MMNCQLLSKGGCFVPTGEIMVQILIPGGSEQLFGYCAFSKMDRRWAAW